MPPCLTRSFLQLGSHLSSLAGSPLRLATPSSHATQAIPRDRDPSPLHHSLPVLFSFPLHVPTLLSSWMAGLTSFPSPRCRSLGSRENISSPQVCHRPLTSSGCCCAALLPRITRSNFSCKEKGSHWPDHMSFKPSEPPST